MNCFPRLIGDFDFQVLTRYTGLCDYEDESIYYPSPNSPITFLISGDVKFKLFNIEETDDIEEKSVVCSSYILLSPEILLNDDDKEARAAIHALLERLHLNPSLASNITNEIVRYGHILWNEGDHESLGDRYLCVKANIEVFVRELPVESSEIFISEPPIESSDHDDHDLDYEDQTNYFPQLISNPRFQMSTHNYTSLVDYDHETTNSPISFLLEGTIKFKLDNGETNEDEITGEDYVFTYRSKIVSPEIMLNDDYSEARAVVDSLLVDLHLIPSDNSDIRDEFLRCGRTLWNEKDDSLGYRYLGISAEIEVYVQELPALSSVFDENDDVFEDPMDFEIGFVAASKMAIESLERVRIGGEQVKVISCSICFEDVLIGSEATKLPCSHLFHGDCIVKWLQNSKYCPLCRYEMPS